MRDTAVVSKVASLSGAPISWLSVISITITNAVMGA